MINSLQKIKGENKYGSRIVYKKKWTVSGI